MRVNFRFRGFPPLTATRIAWIAEGRLSFRRCRIDDTAPLAWTKNLKSLELEDVRLEPAGVRGLSRLGQVEHLHWRRGRMEVESWADALPPNLQTLWIEELPVRDLPLQLAKRCPNLRSLTIRNPTDVEPVDFSPLTALTSLIELRLIDCPVRDEDLAGLAALQSLWEIELTGTQVTDAVCERLGQISTLRIIRLRGTAITDAGCGPLGEIPFLWCINLGETAITDAACERLGRFPSLVSVDLSRTAITDAACEPLGRIPTLIYIDLNNTAVTPAGVEPLLRLPKLGLLWLHETPVAMETPVGKELVPLAHRHGWNGRIEFEGNGVSLRDRDATGRAVRSVILKSNHQ